MSLDQAMGPKIAFCLCVLPIMISVTTSETNSRDSAALISLMNNWANVPPTWTGSDPCGDNWEGITCKDSQVISITLSSMGLEGILSGDIDGVSELQTLDLSYNKGLRGPLPTSIGNLRKLTNLILVGCSFNGLIPESIGSLRELVFLSLNSNSFTGRIPASIGNLTNLYWLDLAENRLTGNIPVSNGTTPGLDFLVDTKHFHFGRNQLTGSIPSQLLNSNMKLIHLLFDNNQLTGSIPSTLGLVTKLEVLRLDGNSLSGPVPSNLNNLTSVNEMLLSNNKLTGPLPNLTGMNHLSYLDLSNNSFDASEAPAWFSSLASLTVLLMQQTKLQGEIPVDLFSRPQLQTVTLSGNKLNGTLNLGTNFSTQLELVDVRNNGIVAFTQTAKVQNVDQILLAGNPVCQETAGASTYCTNPEQNNTLIYSTAPINCVPGECNSGQISSPRCQCAYPYTGTLVFRAIKILNLGNSSYFTTLETELMQFFTSHDLPVDSVALSNPTRDSMSYLEITLGVFPSEQDRFNRTGISSLGFVLSNQTFKPSGVFGPFFFIGHNYTHFAVDYAEQPKKRFSMALIIGLAAGGLALLLLVVAVGAAAVICRPTKTSGAPQAVESSYPRESTWDSFTSGGSIPQVVGPRSFSLEELRKCTNNFSETNDIGSGGYGKVYKGVLGGGQLVAVKRVDSGSAQGGLEFKAEIELLSRLHHKNVVSLLGFCFERNELLLVYEYVPNGTLTESLSGKTGIRMDWRRRLKVALGAARGLQYLHELANPPIIHRDVKSSNILLDEHLNAKVSDFGLSKTLIDSGKGYISTQVKGTMGYMDPEYYMTQKLTEKSDVYSFGVLMLELITGKLPIQRGRYIVREIRNAIDKTQDLYNLHELLDPSIGLGTTLGGFEQFIDVALRCVEECGSNRPTMGEVVKELENIVEAAGLNPYIDSASTSASFAGHSRTSSRNGSPLYK